MQQMFDVKVEMIPSGGGVFEVVVDGDLVYSKKAAGEFPDEALLLKNLKST
jgi:selenoprotein W-related protein